MINKLIIYLLAFLTLGFYRLQLINSTINYGYNHYCVCYAVPMILINISISVF